MAGRHQPQYARYTSSNNQGYQQQNISYNQQQQQQSYSGNTHSPYSTTSSSPSAASNYQSPNVQAPQQRYHNPPLKKYVLQPPPRKLPLSKSMPSLGYPGMFPQRPNQEEDSLTESNMRHGFVDRPLVMHEHTCVHDIVYGKLQDDQRLLSELGSFMVDVLQRQSRSGLITGPSTYKPPARNTLTDPKKEQWMQELAGGVVPLRKLARNAPHGFKGEKLLDALAAKQVPFLRATWFIKIIGVSEMIQRSAGQAKDGPSQSNLWTMLVTGHLRKQLMELMPQQQQHQQQQQQQRQYNHSPKVWSSAEHRSRFEAKWNYCIKLTQWQYFEGLLDQKTFLRWTLENLGFSQSFEITWMVLKGIIVDYVDEYKRNRTLTKMLIEHLIKSYSALAQFMQHHPSSKLHVGLKQDIEQTLQSLFLSAPDMFVIPKLYYQYHHLFHQILTATDKENEISQVMKVYWQMIKSRNQVFCGSVQDDKEPQPQQQQSQSEAYEERIVHILDSIGKNVDSVSGLLLNGESWIDIKGHTAKSAARQIFGINKLPPHHFIKLLHIMLQWATSASRYGDWKAYLVASILVYFRGQDKTSTSKAIFQDALISFLDNDSNDDAEEDLKNNSPIIYLFDVLIRLHLFSYQKYLLRLIARGDLEPKRRHIKHVRRCLHHLASFPLLNPAPTYLVNQRRVALYGTQNDIDSKVEIEALDKLKHLARMAVAGFDHADSDCLFGAEAKDMTQPVPADSFQSYELAFASEDIKTEFMQIMDSTTRYSVLNFTSHWLLNEVKRFVVKAIQIGEDNWRVMTSPGSCLLNTRQYVTIIRIMEYAQDYLTIIDCVLWVLEKSNDPALYPYIIDTLAKYANYIKLTYNGLRVAQAVWAKHISSGRKDRCIMMYMVQLVQEGFPIEQCAQLQQDLQVKSKRGIRYNVSVKDEMVQLAKNPETLQLVSESLCVPSQNASGWLGAIVESAGEVLHLVSKDKSSMFDLHRILRAFALVLKDVANHTVMTGQADEPVIQWLSNHPLVLEDMNRANSWVPVFVALLVSYNVVGLSNIMRQFALPWFEQVHYRNDESPTFCQNLITMIRLLIVQSSNHAETSWQLRIEEYYRLEVQRQSQLASSLDRIEPMFGLMERLVMIATNLPLSSNLLQDLVLLRADLLQITWFRQACLRDLNGVYQRFAAREAEATMEKRMKKKMLNIVDELIGGSNPLVQESAPDFVDKLHRVFLNVSQWNEAQCRVQVNLLLDNISLSEGQSQNNPHILGDDLSMDIISTETASNTNKDLQSFVHFFYDVILLDGKEETDAAKAQRKFQFFKNLIHELREPVLLELLNHGARLLEASEDSFPDNVLLMQHTELGQPFDSSKFKHRSQAFLNMTQHMLAENVWNNDKKMDMVKTVFKQIKRYKTGLSVYKVMQGANVCYADALNALLLVKNNVDMAIALLVTEGLPPDEEVDQQKNLCLQDIRSSLLIRLRLVVPFASLIWEHPKEDECNILDWIRVLVLLLGNPIVHGNGSQERFFEFTLDFVSLLIDEVPKELKKASLNLLGGMTNELSSVPAMFHSRVKRIMPFLTHNVYLANSRFGSSFLGVPATSDPQLQQQYLETCVEQSKPWEWLEDIVGEPPHDNDAPINLALFDAKKSKKVDGTYVKWFNFGFDEGAPNDGHSHISVVDNQPKEENGFVFNTDEDEPVETGSNKRKCVEMEDGELP